LPSAKGHFRLAPQFVGRNDENALRVFVGHVNHLQVPSDSSLANLHSGASRGSRFLPRTAENLPDFFLSHTVVMDMGLAGIGIEVESDPHQLCSRR
jgi:hypothetical protein